MISREGSGVLKLMERRKEMQLLVVEGLLKTAEQAREHARGQEETRAAGDPTIVVGGRSRRQEQHNGDGG